MSRLIDSVALLAYTVAALLLATVLCATSLARDCISGLRRIWSAP